MDYLLSANRAPRLIYSQIDQEVLGRLSLLEKWIIANSTKNDLFPKCPADLTVYKSSHQAPFIFSDADYMKRNERKEACNRTLENKLLFLRVPPIPTGFCRWCLVGWLLAPTRWFSALLCAMLVRMIFTVFFTFFSLLKFLKGILNFIHALLVREMRSLGRLKSVALVGQQTSHFRNARWTGDGKFGHQQRL